MFKHSEFEVDNVIQIWCNANAWLNEDAIPGDIYSPIMDIGNHAMNKFNAEKARLETLRRV